MWPLAFHQFVTARDRAAFVERQLEFCDFLPVTVRPGSASARLQEELLSGYPDGWGTTRATAVEVDCVLAALGLLHMKVKCVIPEELGGDYKPEVSARLSGKARCGKLLTIVEI